MAQTNISTEPIRTEPKGEKPLELRLVRECKDYHRQATIEDSKEDYRPFSIDDFKAEYGGTFDPEEEKWKYITKDQKGHLRQGPYQKITFDTNERYSANDVLEFIKKQDWKDPDSHIPCYPLTNPNKRNLGHLTLRYVTDKKTYYISFNNIDLSNSPYEI